MKINGYIVEIVCANYDKENKCYGDIYEEVEECLQEHPNDEIVIRKYNEGDKLERDFDNLICKYGVDKVKEICKMI